MKPVYIIAEAGVNHNGQLDLALQLIDAAKKSGADAVKFQTFRTENIVTHNAGLAEYQKENLGTEESQFQMLKALELSYDDFTELYAYARTKSIDFLSTPDDEESLDFLVDDLGLPLIKIGSGEVSNLPFLRIIAAKQKSLILSTGMSTLGEVERAVRVIRDINGEELMLLHCTTNYPCPPEEVNLKAMLTMQQAFGLSIGYSDHTLGTEVSIAAVALGAEVIEKHLTLDKKMEGPDHRASLDPEEFAEMVRQIRVIEKVMGNGIKWPNPSEERIKPLVRRRIVASQDLVAGTSMNWNHLCFKRANQGLYADQAESILGLRLQDALKIDEPISLDCFFPHDKK